MHDLFTEDLAWQALRGLELGQALCACDGYYHSVWGSLRIAGVNNTMKGETPLLTELMSPYLRDDTRVMIGGAADPGVLCGIGRIHKPRMPHFTVIDKCEAPLALIREFAAAKGLQCRTVHRDLLELDGSEEWDQIVLHYTPDFVDASLRSRLFVSLATSLAPEGILVCATMTGAAVPHERRPEMEAAFFAEAVIALRQTPMAGHAETAEFKKQLMGYAACRTIRRLTLPSTDQICELAREAGLQIVQRQATSRQRRLLGGMDVVDTSSIIIARRP